MLKVAWCEYKKLASTVPMGIFFSSWNLKKWANGAKARRRIHLTKVLRGVVFLYLLHKTGLCEKTCLREFKNNKGADQPAHPRSLISAFVIRLLESILSRLARSEI